MFWYKWNTELKQREWTCEEAKKEYTAYKATLPKVSLRNFIKNPNIYKELKEKKTTKVKEPS